MSLLFNLPQVVASLTGSLLATMLFIPGICMIIGGVKFKEQRFNWRSAGVGSSLLFVSVAGAFSPSIFQNVFGTHTLSCQVNMGQPVSLPLCLPVALSFFLCRRTVLYFFLFLSLVSFSFLLSCPLSLSLLLSNPLSLLLLSPALLFFHSL